MGGGLDDPSFGKDEIDKIHFGPDLIWERESPYKSGEMVLTIVTTKEKQVVNLGYNLGRWENKDKAAQEIPHYGTVNWGDDSDEYTFTGNEGTSTSSGLYHTYGKAGEYRITIKGVVKWNKVSISSSSTSAPDSIRTSLTKIEIPEGETSPIYYIDTYAFYSCRNLESILGNLFENCTEVTSFSGCFGNTQITEIPQGLFDKCTQATNFNNCFQNAQITAVPQDLFAKCTQATNFSYCFGNTQITEIPKGLFDKCTQATNFNNCFYNMKITEIPSGLFDQCTQAMSFNYCFYNTKITAIPEKLFDKCMQATNFGSCFSSTSITAIPSGLFANNNKVNNFTQTFYSCTLVKGNLPALWESHPSASHTKCFYDCTQADNYQDAVTAGWA